MAVRDPIELYFDTAATAPVRAVVKNALSELIDVYGNPSSLHRKGLEAEAKLEEARMSILQVLGNPKGTFVFTGSGSEANNLAILGAAKEYKNRGRHAVTTMIEHPAVLEPFRQLTHEGFEVTYVKPESSGDINPERVLEAIREDTVIVSLMHVNNETGAILPIHEVGQALKDKPKVIFHVDGVQGFCKVPFTLKDSRIDLYTVSGHKVGAMKGIGGLYIRDGIHLSPIVYGGGQERNLRSGTQNVPGALTFGLAAKDAKLSNEVYEDMRKKHQILIDGLKAIPGWTVHLPRFHSPFIVHASATGLRGEVLLHAFESQGLYVSTGSACSSHKKHSSGSHVLQAMDCTEGEKTGAIRFSIGTNHTEHDILACLEIVEEQTKWIRSML